MKRINIKYVQNKTKKLYKTNLKLYITNVSNYKIDIFKNKANYKNKSSERRI